MFLLRSRSFYFTVLSSIIGLSLSYSACAANSIVRIRCTNAGSEAKIYINGQLKDRCPKTDIFVDGPATLDVYIKDVDGDYERTYQRRLTVAAGVAKSLSVTLGERQLTKLAAKRLQQEKQQREKAEQARQAKLLQDEYQQTLDLARKGDYAAMVKMNRLYLQGKGVAPSKEKAQFWRNKAVAYQIEAANKGDASSVQALIERYRTGDWVEASPQKVAYWSDKLETIRAQKDIASAKQGDVKAMTALIERYASGTGVKKDAQKVAYWQQQKQQRLAQISEQQKKAKAKKTLTELNYFFWSGTIVKGMQTPDDRMNPLSKTTLFPFALTGGVLSDLISAPFKLSSQIKASRELAAHPALWANPDSMVAKAYLQSFKGAQADRLYATTR